MSLDYSDSPWIQWAENSKKKKLSETLELTYNLFLQGKSVKEIAIAREFKEESIERQLIDLIAIGFISVKDLVNKEKYDKIVDIIEKKGASSLILIKNDLGKNYSWFEIKCVLASFASKPRRLS